MNNYLELYKSNLNLDKSKNSELLRKYEEYIRNPKKSVVHLIKRIIL